MHYLYGEWKKIRRKLKGRFLFLFLDFDGTLAPLAGTPGQAKIAPRTRRLLKDLTACAGMKVAIISGRAVKDVEAKVKIKNIIYSGNHGLELAGPKIKFKSHIPEKYFRVLEKIKNDLRQKLEGIPGVLIEEKGPVLAVHYRKVRRKQQPDVKIAFREAVILARVRGKIKTFSGKKVMEIRPVSDWDKGKTVLWLLGRMMFSAGRKSVLPIYLGDDKTDEDAFRVLKKRGITVFVGRPRVSQAEYYLKNPAEVFKFLRLLKIECVYAKR